MASMKARAGRLETVVRVFKSSCVDKSPIPDSELAAIMNREDV